MDTGWMLFKKVVNADGTVRRHGFSASFYEFIPNTEFLTENTRIVCLDDFKTDSLESAWDYLIEVTRHKRWSLYPYIKEQTEWIKPECLNDFITEWDQVKEDWAIGEFRKVTPQLPPRTATTKPELLPRPSTVKQDRTPRSAIVKPASKPDPCHPVATEPKKNTKPVSRCWEFTKFLFSSVFALWW